MLWVWHGIPCYSVPTWKMTLVLLQQHTSHPLVWMPGMGLDAGLRGGVCHACTQIPGAV